ncbi:MAG: threonine synthase [Archangium sp.]|nr:threonine synthase [Archangium sp.]MDP3156735.1 threonine synthase [Archangium sp.]MDP3574647.1 threonine synthase [Archangium sp.]
MKVISTRGGSEVSVSEAISVGLAPDGGLYTPPSLAAHSGPWGHDLRTRVSTLLRPFFAGEVLEPSLEDIVQEAFTFDAPTKWLSEDTGLLELFHGPTAAFKDFGARFLAACLARLTKVDRVTTVLVATSGDTGAAVASAFHRRPGFRVVILYPDGRVSPRQAHQLGAFGDNVSAFRVDGTFDDCQRMVKAAFGDRALSTKHALVSANSISLGRLLPQMAYYAQASLSALEQGRGSVSFVVPTGNLGNAFACLLAKECGLPIDRVVLATNANRVLADFLATGHYEPKASLATLANAMDVGAPSNVERLRHRFPEVAKVVEADWVDDETIRSTITRTLEQHGEIICPHTACGVEVLRRVRTRGAKGTWIVAATAHPAKFDSIVEPLIGRPVPVPPALAELLSRPSRAEPLAATVAALSVALT